MRSGGNNFNYYFREQTDQIGKFSGVLFSMGDWGRGVRPPGPPSLATPLHKVEPWIVDVHVHLSVCRLSSILCYACNVAKRHGLPEKSFFFFLQTVDPGVSHTGSPSPLRLSSKSLFSTYSNKSSRKFFCVVLDSSLSFASIGFV